jgi:hypothetical protein
VIEAKNSSFSTVSAHSGLAGVDVKRTLLIAAVDVAVGRVPAVPRPAREMICDRFHITIAFANNETLIAPAWLKPSLEPALGNS